MADLQDCKGTRLCCSVPAEAGESYALHCKTCRQEGPMWLRQRFPWFTWICPIPESVRPACHCMKLDKIQGTEGKSPCIFFSESKKSQTLPSKLLSHVIAWHGSRARSERSRHGRLGWASQLGSMLPPGALQSLETGGGVVPALKGRRARGAAEQAMDHSPRPTRRTSCSQAHVASG